MPSDIDETEKEEFDDAIEKSAELVKKKSVIEKICPALKSISGDLKEVAKVVTASLLPLSMIANPIVPLSPLIYGGISVIVFTSWN